MNSELYLKRLRRRIKSLPDNERNTIIDFYREIIQDKIESGVSEAQAVAELGDVNVLAQKILMENPNRKPVNVGKIVGIVLASVFGVIFVAMLTVGILGIATFQGNKVANSVTASTHEVTAGNKVFTSPEAGISSIRIEAENKEVTVIAADSNDIKISYMEDKDEDYSVTNENGLVTLVNQSHRHGSFSFQFFDWGNHDIAKIIVYVPKNYAKNISISTTNSVIQISDFSELGDLSCKTTNSVIKMEKVDAKNITMETQNAAITLKDIAAGNQLSAETQNGKISLDHISAQEISLQTQNAIIGGTIDGAQSDYTIETHTTNAISNLHDRSGGSKKLTASTTNAIINLDFSN